MVVTGGRLYVRYGDKLASYELMAEALEQLETANWQLRIAGDGEAREAVERLMAPFGRKVTFLGQLDRSELEVQYADAAFFVWPGVNEAYGMVYLEAQAAGLTVVAQDRDGVRDVLAPSGYPDPKAGPLALARRMDALMRDPVQTQQLGATAREYVRNHHLRPEATRTLWQALTPLLETIA